MKKLLLLLLLLISPYLIYATIIIPPQDIGQMVHDADLVVYGKIIGHKDYLSHQNELEIIKLIKGSVDGDYIIVDEYSQQVGDLQSVVAGDTDFKIGENYLLFLKRLFVDLDFDLRLRFWRSLFS